MLRAATAPPWDQTSLLRARVPSTSLSWWEEEEAAPVRKRRKARRPAFPGMRTKTPVCREGACVLEGRRRRPESSSSFSRSSMQAALEVAARHCHKETEAYGQCVAANPSSWLQECHQLKAELTKCTSSHPIVQKIRQDCAEPFTAFEQCLKLNQTSVVNCSEYVQKFLLCADQVKLAT